MNKNKLAIVAAVLVAAIAAYFVFFRDKGDKQTEPDDSGETANRPIKKRPAQASSDNNRGGGGELSVLFDDDPEGNLVLEGQVIDSTDDPVAGAIVSIDSNPPRSVTTGDDGSFSIPKLVGRSYQVVARSPVGVAGPVSVSLTDTNDPVILRVKKGGSVTVTVVKASDGEALSGASVELRGIDVQSQSTGADGVARFSGVVPSFYAVVASADGFAKQNTWTQVRATGSGAEVRLALRQGAPVSGIVVSAGGKPVEGARVIYGGASDWSQQADPRHDAAVTAADGRFKFAAMPAGTFRFVARADKQAPGRSDLTTLDGATAVDDVRIELAPGAAIRGRVLDASNKPVAAARVRVSSAAGNFTERVREAYADDKGNYEIDGLERKELEVVAIGREASSEIVEVDLVAAPFDRTVDLRLDVGGQIAGIVVDGEGEPIEGAQVWAFPDWRRGGRDNMQSFRMRGIPRELSDAGGRFKLTGLSDGPYQVRASRSAGGGRFGGGWTVPPVDARTGDTDVRIELAAEGTITGKVAFANGDAPAAFSVNLGGWGQGTPFSSKSGKFEVPELAPRKYTVTIRGPGFDSKQIGDVEVKPGETTDLGTIEVEKGRSVAGKVVDAGGSPVADALVRAGRTIFGDGSSSKSAFGGPPGAQNTKEVRTDESGRFAIFGLGPSDISVVAEHETMGRSKAILIRGRASTADLSLQLAPFGALEGTVTRGGKPAERVFVSVASLTTPDVSYGVATGDDGKYRYDKLAPDEYKVQAFLMRGMGGFGTRAPKRVVVASGKTARADLAYDAGTVDVLVAIKEAGGKALGFTWVAAMTGEVTATNARDMQLEIGRSESSTQNAFSIGGSEARLLDLSPRSYSICAIPYPSEVSGMADTMAYGEREGDKLPVYCKPIDVAETPGEQAITIEVTVPAFVPAET